MSSALCLLGYAGWTLALVGVLVVQRVVLVLRGRPANTFTPTGEDVSPFSARLCRAHANCVENLPVAAGVLGVALLTGHDAITDPLAPWLLGARVAQSSVHLASTAPWPVQIRFGFLMVQHGILWWWIVQLSLALWG